MVRRTTVVRLLCDGFDLFCIVSLKYVSNVVSWGRIKVVAVVGGGKRRMRSEEDDDDGGNCDDELIHHYHSKGEYRVETLEQRRGDKGRGVLVWSGLSRVWRNSMCDPVLRRSDNTGIGVVDRTTSPAPVGTVIARASPEEISVTRPDHKVVTKADHAAKRKASTRPKISTNMAKKTRSNKKGSGVGSSGQAAGDEVEQTNDGTLDDDDQRDGSEFAMEGIENLNDVSQDKEVEAHAELSGGVRRATRASVSEDVSPLAQETVPAPNIQPLDADVGADEIASDGDVDLYYEARVGNTARDVLERDLIPFVPGPYYIPYPYDEGFRSETAFDRFPTPAETHRLRELSSVKLNVERLSKQCAQQTHAIKRQSANLKQQNESTVRADEEVSRLTAELRVLKSRCQTVEHKLSSWDKKHRKYRNERDTLAMEKAKITEELIGTNHSWSIVRGQLRISRVALPLSFGQISLHLFEGSLRVSSLQDIARLEPDRVTSSHHTSSDTASLRANTHVRYSTSSSGTFDYTSTLEHLKKKEEVR
uniref:Uncharacterized protein n=1 Tax=Tanacetum cinerariifolium TaxID=118510 RepID=A0A699H0R7_TANCI|nr:hypothetical protein [Tanacetum cinerariifolium]